MEGKRVTLGSDDFTFLQWHEYKKNLENPMCIVSIDDWDEHFYGDYTAIDTRMNIAKEDVCPDRVGLHMVKDMPLFDAEGNSRTFGSLFDPQTAVHHRQLFIFVRHFYCGACQAYLKALSEGVTINDFFTMPIPTSIFIIGCGEPELIPQYRQLTGCPYPMFTDPSRQLFKRLGMGKTLNIGTRRPEYMKDVSPVAWAGGQLAMMGRDLRTPNGIRRRDVFRAGNWMQIGGEFLFEDGDVIFAHRMRHYRDHTEIGVLRQLLDLD